MFDPDEKDSDFDLEITLDEGIAVNPQELDNARVFFMSMLEATEATNLNRYNAAEAHLKEVLGRFKGAYADGSLTPEMVVAGKQAYDEMTEAKAQLNASMARVAYAMSHTAFA